MRTSKPISTISYNSVEFISDKMNEWLKTGLIAYWCIMPHKGEILDDGTQEKDHLHIFIEPNKKVDTVALQFDSQEYDPSHPDKPFKCIHFEPSDYANWTWYVLHDPLYLSMKFEQRQYQYDKSEFIASDPDEFEDRYQRAIHSSTVTKSMKIQSAYANGFRASDLAVQGLLMPNQAVQFMAFDKLYNEGEKRLKNEIKRREELEAPICNDDGQSVLFPDKPISPKKRAKS